MRDGALQLLTLALLCYGVGSLSRDSLGATPFPLPVAHFEGKDGWILLGDVKVGEDAGHVAMIERSKTQRAGCRMCGDLIPKGEPRLGYPLPDPRGRQGWINGWQHWKCSRLSPAQCPSLSRWVHGWEALGNATEMLTLEEGLRRETPPGDSEEEEESEPQVQGGITSAGSIPAPAAMVGTLLPFQGEGLAWMCQQEDTGVSGGVLADEMGLGKTIQTIALLLNQRASDSAWRLNLAEGSSPHASDRVRAGTGQERESLLKLC